ERPVECEGHLPEGFGWTRARPGCPGFPGTVSEHKQPVPKSTDLKVDLDLPGLATAFRPCTSEHIAIHTPLVKDLIAIHGAVGALPALHGHPPDLVGTWDQPLRRQVVGDSRQDGRRKTAVVENAPEKSGGVRRTVEEFHGRCSTIHHD